MSGPGCIEAHGHQVTVWLLRLTFRAPRPACAVTEGSSAAFPFSSLLLAFFFFGMVPKTQINPPHALK
jgi:hypothetical protein